ncbi:MAG: DUF885 domain-containing protein [Acidobacteriota bacterium]|nr:DUF885 domain-containing protein [Acidobacteriota bacterium]
MFRRHVPTVFCAVAALAVTIGAQNEVPRDLRPLLAKPVSEMRLVVTRYNADRQTLNRNYAGPGGFNMPGGRGRGAAQPAGPAPQPVPVSTARLARLKRLDLDWQAALSRMPAATLTPAAAQDLAALQSSINANLGRLEAENLLLAQMAPALAYAPKLVALIEARIRVDEINSEHAARTLNDVRNQLVGVMAEPPFRMNAANAARAVEATDTLRAAMTEWFNFYNGYDPMFSWWMPVPFKHLDKALQDYAGFLRDKVADNGTAIAPASTPAIQPAPAPRHPSVPDLVEIIALPQDEMRDIVARFNADGARSGGAGGAQPEQAAAPRAPRNNQAWLAALTSLDFDALSRNAQVDYLYVKWRAETDIAQAAATIPPGPPFRADASKIQGKPRGREGLIADLRDNMIPYTPEQLIALANREFEWCQREMKKASRALGFGDDWKAALEKVKQTAVAPGDQPRMIKGLVDEAVAYLRAQNLVTVPAVAAESLRMTMMSAEAQQVNPFFLGGDHIIVSYPTAAMEFDARMQSMRGNNPNFSNATAHHELIPGHNLVGYMNQRYRDYRPSLTSGGPFYGEGWPLYWELTLYELGFNTTPEERIGALFWRMHRCARIIFSLNFHMGQWTPLQAVDFLVDKIGHERDNATAEVRRSFESPQYQNQPLYQAAYLLGGLQFRGLRRELVDSKQMTNKAFHDELLRQGNMPVALLRLRMTKQKLTRDMDINWKFYGNLPEK